MALGFYCFSLPSIAKDTKTDQPLLRQMLCLDAFHMLGERTFLIFILCSTLISVPLAMYYAYTSTYLGAIGVTNAAGTLALGQLSELLFMLMMPFLYRRFGVKPLLMAGMVAWAIRYALFAIGDGGAQIWAIYAGVLLHGICYDFFFVAGEIYTNQIAADKGLSTQAQGLLTMFTYGIGMLLGSQIGAQFYALMPLEPGLTDWHEFWWHPSLATLAVSAIFQVLFREKALVSASGLGGAKPSG